MRTILITIALLSLLLTASGLGTAAELNWSSVTSGGNHTITGIYTLDSAIGQPAARVLYSTNPALCSGFLCAAVDPYEVFLPVVSKP